MNNRLVIRTGVFAVLTALALAILATGPARAAELTELKIALLPNESPDAEIKKHATMTQHLEKHLGIPVKVQVGIDYTAVIEALRNNHVQVAYLGPFSYVLAHEAMDGNVEPLVTGVRTKTGKSSYNSVIIARKDSGIESEEDFKDGKTISFSDPASTSGFLVPTYRFSQLGIDPQKDFKSVLFAGGHAASLMAVANGKVDGAGTNLPSLQRGYTKDLIKEEDVIIVWTSPDIPGSPVSIRKDLHAELKYKLVKAFMGIPEGVDTYEGKMSRYEPAFDFQYDIIRDIKAKLKDKM